MYNIKRRKEIIMKGKKKFNLASLIEENASLIEDNASYHPAEPEMVFVQGGTFMMGTPKKRIWDDSHDDERPVHKVTVSDFYISKYVVTQEQWKAVMDNNPSHFLGEKLPVESVSWDDVQVFINKLNSLTGKKYRLPTEAEWEFAARGGNKSKGYIYSCSTFISDVAWFLYNSDHKTHPVGTRSPNELGIYDMSGNVEEWCSDWYGEYCSNAQTNPQGPLSGPGRVNRGGGYYYIADGSRVSCRNYRDSVEDNDSNLGFRLVRSSK